MSTKKLGRTQTWLFEQAKKGALIDGLPADKVKAGDEREIQQMKRSAAVLLGQGD